MALLPPVGWADVATKQDLAHLAERPTTRFDAVGLQFKTLEATLIGELHRTLISQIKMLFFGIMTVLTSIAGIALAVASILSRRGASGPSGPAGSRPISRTAGDRR